MKQKGQKRGDKPGVPVGAFNSRNGWFSTCGRAIFIKNEQLAALFKDRTPANR